MEPSVNGKIIGLTILLAEDDSGDVELMLAALEEIHLADRVVVVKNGDFSEFVRAVKELGAFWAGVNEPRPYDGEEEDLLQRRAVSSPAKREVNDEIPAPHPALGG
jgi:hypothetical protein